ncbi:peroxiredoxin [Marinicella gelatinilytica]|uniref:peroxiredoxin n=1 Tax=Marinicella gelatinilytica TaxID=2996017 RepID=UPI002260C0A0|nr:peroxiredoxin [Marinicella gelatinilytica]MCX7545540.1 peroxiredoxin [Marinicella gelatinilytica]
MKETMLKIEDNIMQTPVLLTNGATSSLAQMVENYVCIFFYPRANTPGCSQESQDFSAAYSAFTELGCEIIGVSADSLKKQQNFKEKFNMPFQLVADTEEVLCRAFDVIKEKNMYGKKFMGIERSTFVLNAQGDVVLSWRKVKVKGHVEDVLQQVKQLINEN